MATPKHSRHPRCDGQPSSTNLSLAPIRGSLRALRWFLTALLVSLAGCASMGALDFDDPEVELLGLEPLASQGLEARFLVKLRIVNPNSIPLAIDGIAYDVSIRGSKVLSGVSNDGISVGAYSESIAELEVAAGMNEVLAYLLSIDPPGKTIFSAHAPVLLEEGYDTLEMLGDADVADLVDVGLKKPHAKKMLKSLAGYTKGI